MNTVASSSLPLGGEAIAVRALAIAPLLRESRSLWQQNAFAHRVLSWEADFPALAVALRGLGLGEAESLQADAAAAEHWFARWLDVGSLRAICHIARWSQHGPESWPRDSERDIPGRKWAQITAFVAALEDAGLDCVEWCAGKAHLGRCLSQQWRQRPVVALERDAELVRSAAHLAARAQLPIVARRCDVMSPDVAGFLGDSVHVLALHACGDLHLRLFDCAIAAGVPRLACAPCCYQLGGRRSYEGLSMLARTQSLALNPADMRTAVQETVTAPTHARLRRRRVQQWQLGFDLLQRELRGVDSYLPIPATPVALLDGDFATFCRHLAERKQIEIPAGVDFSGYESAGRERFREVTALDLVRHMFRRLLELWLVLDRAQYLREHGYRVELGEFCARDCTPRNLLLQASLA